MCVCKDKRILREKGKDLHNLALWFMSIKKEKNKSKLLVAIFFFWIVILQWTLNIMHIGTKVNLLGESFEKNKF